MKKLFPLFLLIFIVSCSKNDDDSFLIYSAKSYDDIVIHVALGGTTGGQSITLQEGKIWEGRTITYTNLPDGYIHYLEGRSGDHITISGMRYGTGYSSISFEVYVDGTLEIADGENALSDTSKAYVDFILP